MKRVLVIHGDDGRRKALEAVLSKAGYEVLAAKDAAAGVDLYKGRKPDLVIVDQELQKMTGTEVFGSIRRLDPKAKVVVFSLLGDGESPSEQRTKYGVPALQPAALLKVVGRLLPKAGGKGGRTPRVLVVDDNPGVRNLLFRFFAERGFEVSTAADGAGALSVVRKNKPDLILLDIEMPKMTGIEVLKQIRQTEPEVGVLMITGHDQLELMEECRDLGAADYILKPFDLEYLELTAFAKVLSIMV